MCVSEMGRKIREFYKILRSFYILDVNFMVMCGFNSDDHKSLMQLVNYGITHCWFDNEIV